MKRYFNILLVLVLFLAVSCSKSSNKKGMRPSVSGNPNSVLVVMNASKWESEAGDSIRAILSESVEGLPQEEPLFDVMNVTHDGFTKIFKQERNIIITQIGSNYKKPEIKVQKNTWAHTQLLMTISAPNEASFIELLDAERNRIVQIMKNMENMRLIEVHEKSPNKGVNEVIKGKFGIHLSVPKAYETNVEDENFMWITHDYRDVLEGIFIYKYPYMDTNTFTAEFLIEKRNEVLQKYAEGEVEGSYMGTEVRYPISFSEYKMKGEVYTVELRGLWKMENGLAMGGPFVSLTQFVESTGHIVTVEGYVFAPGHEKRDLIRRQEAILYSIEQLGQEEENGN